MHNIASIALIKMWKCAYCYNDSGCDWKKSSPIIPEMKLASNPDYCYVIKGCNNHDSETGISVRVGKRPGEQTSGWANVLGEQTS